MEIHQAQAWVRGAWQRSEKQMDPLTELACLMEECGELAEAIRKKSHGKNKSADMEKEMGDILLSLFTLAIRNKIDLERAFKRTQQSIEQRYVNE